MECTRRNEHHVMYYCMMMNAWNRTQLWPNAYIHTLQTKHPTYLSRSLCNADGQKLKRNIPADNDNEPSVRNIVVFVVFALVNYLHPFNVQRRALHARRRRRRPRHITCTHARIPTAHIIALPPQSATCGRTCGARDKCGNKVQFNRRPARRKYAK